MLICDLVVATGTTVFAELDSFCGRYPNDLAGLCSELIEGRSVLDGASISGFDEVVGAGSAVDEEVLLG
jgi:hypothetical protein